MGKLDNRIAVVTGAAGGLGAGIAHHLATEGAIVVCADISDATGLATALPRSPSGVSSGAVSLDVSNTADVEATLASIVEDFGGIDIMVNNAGVAQPILNVIDSDDELFERVFSVNVGGVVACSRAAARIMIEQGRGGRIINTASARAKLPWPGLGVYSASKAAVVALTQSLALELAGDRITANAICPGTMWTEMSKDAFAVMAQAQGIPREDLMAGHVEGIPAGRLGTPDDMGAMVAFLASDQASFVTGACFNLTGGEDAFF